MDTLFDSKVLFVASAVDAGSNVYGVVDASGGLDVTDRELGVS
jgi:hypothetical protein